MFVKEYTPHPLKKLISKLRQHRGVNDLLSYLIILDDSTILHKDGALSRHFIYTALDCESLTDSLLDHHAQTWSQALSFLGDGWMVETNVISLPFQTEEGAREYPDVVSALIADERRLQFQHDHYFQNSTYLTLSYKPDQQQLSRFKQFAINGAAKHDEFNDTLNSFNKTVNEFIGYLKRSLIAIRPLKNNELTTFLHSCITGATQRLAKPISGAFLDSYLSSQDFIAGFQPKIGEKFIKVLAIDGLPAQSYPTLCERFSFFPVHYRWSSRFVCLDTQTTQGYLKRYGRSWSSKAIGVLGVIRESLGMPAKRDEDAEMMVADIKAMKVANSSGQLRLGFYNSVLVVMHHDENLLNKIIEEMTTTIQQMDFRVRIESVNATDGYLGSLPCHGGNNLRKYLCDSQFMGHAFPTSSVYQGEIKSPCEKDGYRDEPSLLLTATHGARPFNFNLHVGDVGHTAILGPTGQGKSTLTAMIIASHRKYKNSRIVVLDKDHSNRLVVKALGGNYLDLNTDDCQLGVMSRVETAQPETIEEAVNWLSDVCRVQGVDVTPTRQRLLRDSVERLAKETTQYKTLNHLSVQDEALREAIHSFNSGRFQALLNGTASNLMTSDVVGIEMSSLVNTQSDHRDKTIPVIKAIFNELQHAFRDRRPTLLILEEAWLYLRHPLFKSQLTDWFKTLRKANVAVIFISQDLDDIVKSDAASTIQTSCMTRIFLPNPSSTEPAIAHQYQSFGLNEQQIHLIQQGTPKQDYYYVSPLGERWFRLDLKDIARAFLCVAEKNEIEAFDRIYKKDEQRWVLEWLQYKNLSDWYDFAKRHYFEETA